MRLEWIVKTPNGKVGITNVHYPPKATLSETGGHNQEVGRHDPHEVGIQSSFGGP